MAFTEFDKFIDKWDNKYPSKQLLEEYLPLAKDLLYTDEATIVKITTLLSHNIETWAKKYSIIYANHTGIMDKSKLFDKSQWYVPNINFMPMSTSGSTNGMPFCYRRWNSVLWPIEVENHYLMILKEFGLENNPKIMPLPTFGYKNFIKIGKSTNFMDRHGADKATVYKIGLNNLYHNNQNKYYELLLKFLCKNPVDVLLTSGQYVNSLVHHIKRLKITKNIAKLLSNTGERLIKEDANFLINNKNVLWSCDHMRCWDGGAGFFTCKHKTYHTMDNLSYTWENNKKLISTDYFNLASPFVNYWNGDYCKIEDKYRKCECGRFYKNFAFLENRPFSLKGICIDKWKQKIKEANINIKQVKCNVNNIEVVSEKILSDIEKNVVINLMKGFAIIFRIE